MPYPTLPEDLRARRLQPPAEGPIRMVLDTDTFNEIDDQFALTYAVLSPERLQLEAVYAAPFFNDLSTGPKDGMEKSYDEIQRILERLGRTGTLPVFQGSEAYLPGRDTPIDSPAARDLIDRARRMPEGEPLYVAAIAAITNIASALLLAPDIVEKIVVVWLGGHAFSWEHTREFNLYQDVHAANVLFDSGVPMVLIPCGGVASHLITSLPEINAYVAGRGGIGDFLAKRYADCLPDHYGRSRVIWDLSAVAYLVDADMVPADLASSPRVSEAGEWQLDSSRHPIRCAKSVNRDRVFQDFFRKLERFANR